LRAVGDAITGIVCRDDAQPVTCTRRSTTESACAHVVVDELTLEDDRSGCRSSSAVPTLQGDG
jgi:hypothetical protein